MSRGHEHGVHSSESSLFVCFSHSREIKDNFYNRPRSFTDPLQFISNPKRLRAITTSVTGVS